MRLLAFLLAAAVGPIAFMAAALAADGAPARSTWADVESAVIGIVLLVLGIAAAIVSRVLPPLITAWTAKLVEDATTARVKRIDDALDDAIAAGASPSDAADIVADKLPLTLQRSKKNRTDMTREAAVKKEGADRA